MTIRNSEDDTAKRSHAVEDALLLLVTRLAERGLLSTDEAADMVTLVARGGGSPVRVSHSLDTLDKLRKLRAGNGSAAPGAMKLV